MKASFFTLHYSGIISW